MLAVLRNNNEEMFPGARGERQGPFHGKLSRLIARLKNKVTDRRLGFLFEGGAYAQEFAYLEKLVAALFAGRQDQADRKGGIKIIDFSESPRMSCL
jgi:uncharacterized protein